MDSISLLEGKISHGGGHALSSQPQIFTMASVYWTLKIETIKIFIRMWDLHHRILEVVLVTKYEVQTSCILHIQETLQWNKKNVRTKKVQHHITPTIIAIIHAGLEN